MLLLDEPLSALDAKIRVSLRQEIRQIQRELGITTVFVTHDQEEALSISDRIVVMNAGNVEQFGRPFDIYNHPATKFVAGFVGTLNTLNATVADAGAKTVTIGQTLATIPALPATARSGDAVALTLRPEAVSLANGAAHDIVLDGTVSEVSFLGSVIRLKVDLERQRPEPRHLQRPAHPAAGPRRAGAGGNRSERRAGAGGVNGAGTSSFDKLRMRPERSVCATWIPRSLPGPAS